MKKSLGIVELYVNIFGRGDATAALRQVNKGPSEVHAFVVTVGNDKYVVMTVKHIFCTEID